MSFIEVLAIILMIAFGACSLFGLILVVKKVINYLLSNKKVFIGNEVQLNSCMINDSYVFLEMNNTIEKQISTILYYLRLSENGRLYREHPFFLMQNNGANPCEIDKVIEIRHNFTEEQLYI